jgi:uncharacterized membrane protein
MNRTLLCVLAALAPVLSSVANAGRYTFVTINVPGSAPATTRPIGINDLRQIVGTFLDENGKDHGFLLSKGHYYRIDVPGAGGTTANAINNRGQIVANNFLYDQGTFTPITFPGAVETDLTGINDFEYIVGSAGNPAEGLISAFVWHKGVFTELFPDEDYSEAAGINDRGQIVGRHSGDLIPYISEHGRVTEFTVPFPNTGFTAPSGINNFGTIAGSYSDFVQVPDLPRPQERVHGFVYAGGQFTSVDFPGAEKTYFGGIDDCGRIVGYAYETPGIHGFVASPTTPRKGCPAKETP